MKLNTLRLILAACSLSSVLPVQAAANAPAVLADPPTTVTRETVTTHPAVNITPDDVTRARENIRKYRWARKYVDNVTSEANAWLARSDEWIRKQLPAAGACFAYGIAGCPICGGSLGYWDQARASFDDPKHVLCSKGHRLPDDDHMDTGTGYLAPDGRTHYFVGSYNAWVVEALSFKAAENLAFAAALTGDSRYAAKSGFVLDALASIYPECNIGSWDYPSTHNSGRFDRPQYQVARVLVHYVDTYDLICSDPSLDQPSLRPGMSRRENIERNLLLDGADYCYKKSFRGGLNNGTADYIRGALSVGVCLGVPEYVRWAVDGPYGIRAMLDNNVGRDGSYFETASTYSTHARNLYLTFTEPLFNYRGSVYPQGLNLYSDLRFANLMQLHNLSTYCNGAFASYGDSAPQAASWEVPDRPFDPPDMTCLEIMYARTPDRELRGRLGALIGWLARGDIDKMRASGKNAHWLTFHAGEIPEAGAPVQAAMLNRILGSHFQGQKGMAVLRAGSGLDAQSQSLLFRFGPTLNHGHRDDLGISYFSGGNALTYDLGYALGTAHALCGWSKLTTAHNLVLVNEHIQGEKSGHTGGGLELFESLPGLKVAEASSEESYKDEGVSVYRRTCALIGGDDGTPGYLLDIFRVAGGRQHDYIFHALSTTATLQGVELGDEQPGSMAGPGIDYGDKVLVDGDIQGHPGKFGWNPPPGNGFGFLMRPRTAPEPRTSWFADWEISSSTRMRLTMPAGIAQEVITADATGITSLLPRSRYVFARRKGKDLISTFAAVIEPYSTAPLVTKVEQLPCDDAASSCPAIALRISRSDGLTDIVYSSDSNRFCKAGPYLFSGRFVHIRARGDVPEIVNLLGATVHFNKWRVLPEQKSLGGVLADKMDPQKGIVRTTTPLPEGRALEGQTIVFNRSKYSRPTAYRIQRIDKEGSNLWRIQLDCPFILGRGEVSKVLTTSTLLSRIIHEYSTPLGRKGSTGFFTGKLISTQDGRTATIRSTEGSWDGLQLSVDDATNLKTGDVFHYQDLQPRDSFGIVLPLTLTRTGNKQYRLSGKTKLNTHCSTPDSTGKLLVPDGIRIIDGDAAAGTQRSD